VSDVVKNNNNEEQKKKPKMSFTGIVVSNKMKKTVVVAIEYNKLHKLYKKYVKRTKKFKAHDENNDCQIGDLVRLEETRPISKEKYMKVVEIIQRAK
jgi:small subunit ribosomal protein S17